MVNKSTMAITYLKASMFVFVLCMPLVRILNWVFVLVEPFLLLFCVFIFSFSLTILSGKKIVIFIYKVMLYFYAGYEAYWFILSYYLLNYYWVFLLSNMFIMYVLYLYNDFIFAYIFILFYYWFMLLFKAFYYIFFGPYWVKDMSFKEVFLVSIPSYGSSLNSLLGFFYRSLPELFQIANRFDLLGSMYKKDLSQIARLKAYNFSTSYRLLVRNFYFLQYTFIFNTVLNVLIIRFFFFN